MKLSLSLLIILLTFSSFSQEEDKIPNKVQKTPGLLVDHLTKDVRTQYEKVEVIYEWITTNIDYDYHELDSDKPFSSDKVNKTLQSKKAICNEYCRLMQTMLAEVNIKSEIVDGYVHSALKDSMVIPTADTHAWIAVKIDGKWFLADPTWDAGYIGNIKTDKEEKFKEKRQELILKYDGKSESLNIKLKDEGKKSKIEKINKKIVENKENRIKAEEKLTEKEDQAKDFTGRVGFVNYPQKEWFLIPADSFLLSHLPLNPMWQLKGDTIPIRVFAQGKDSIISYLGKDNSKVYPFKKEIAKYRKLDFLERLIWEAENGYAYNSKNSQVKALNYYNYINYISDKKVQKVIPPKHKIYDFRKLLPMVDTANFYVKLAKKESKVRYSFFKKSYGKLYKQDVKKQKVFSKFVTKAISNHEKAIDYSESRNEKLELQSEMIEKKIEKLSSKSSEMPYLSDKETVKYLTDSLGVLVKNFETEKAAWVRAVDSSFLQSLIDTLSFNKYLYRIRNVYVEYQDFELNNFIAEIDTIIHGNNAALNAIYSDSLPIEMLSKNVYKSVGEIATFMVFVKTEIDLLEKNEEIDSPDNVLSSFNKVLLDKYKDMLDINDKAIHHNEWMTVTLISFDSYWDDINSYIMGQEHVIEERYNYAMDRVKHDFDRDQNLYKIISKSCVKWKADFKNPKD